MAGPTITLTGPHGPVMLPEVFERRRQPIAYYLTWRTGRLHRNSARGAPGLPLGSQKLTAGPAAWYLLPVRRGVLRILVLLWLGWYISGPLCEAIDSWDPPQEELHDVARSAGGAATLVAGVFCFGILLLRKWRERYSSVVRSAWGHCPPLIFREPKFPFQPAFLTSASPPITRRI